MTIPQQIENIISLVQKNKLAIETYQHALGITRDDRFYQFYLRIVELRKEFSKKLQAELAELNQDELECFRIQHGVSSSWFDIHQASILNDENSLFQELIKGETIAFDYYQIILSQNLTLVPNLRDILDAQLYQSKNIIREYQEKVTTV